MLEFQSFIMKVFLIIVLVHAVCVAVDSASGRNIGIAPRSDAADYQFSFQVSIQFNSIVFGTIHICSGAVINNRFILTSASCVHEYRPNWINAILGYTRMGRSCTNLSIENIDQHESFSAFPLRNNIALLQTVSEIEFSNQIQPVQLPINWSNDMNRNLTISGWHRSSNIDIVTFTYSNQQFQYNDTSYVECKTKQIHQDNPYGIVCKENEFSGSEYTLDKGSLLTENNYLVGIISLDRYHNSGDPLTYTNISSYVPWIEANLKVKKSSESESKSYIWPYIYLGLIGGIVFIVLTYLFRKCCKYIAERPTPNYTTTPNQTTATSPQTFRRIDPDRVIVPIHTMDESEHVPSAPPSQSVPTAPSAITPLPNASTPPPTPPPSYDTLFPVKVEDDSDTRF
ncbi:chymotrypsin-1-like [Sitodiplosis mosellana]|uniref:chymotrypsin-1-like n=1 Tax=Sitodiplosis mosellana TaxID=263140 RepID=UPI002444785B|nr:chymotrypsin-1-like [Sitodiplosis mosellana]